MKKPAFCIGESKGTDQLRGNCGDQRIRAADLHLCFRNIDCSIPLIPKSEGSKLFSKWMQYYIDFICKICFCL